MILSSVALCEDEGGCLTLADEDIIEGLKEEDLSVLAHLHGGKSPNLEGLKTTMGRVRCCGSFSMQQLDDNYYQIFSSVVDTVDYVLSNEPWNFENNLVLLRPRTTQYQIKQLGLDKEFF